MNSSALSKTSTLTSRNSNSQEEKPCEYRSISTPETERDKGSGGVNLRARAGGLRATVGVCESGAQSAPLPDANHVARSDLRRRTVQTRDAAKTKTGGGVRHKSSDCTKGRDGHCREDRERRTRRAEGRRALLRLWVGGREGQRGRPGTTGRGGRRAQDGRSECRIPVGLRGLTSACEQRAARRRFSSGRCGGLRASRAAREWRRVQIAGTKLPGALRCAQDGKKNRGDTPVMLSVTKHPSSFLESQPLRSFAALRMASVNRRGSFAAPEKIERGGWSDPLPSAWAKVFH